MKKKKHIFTLIFHEMNSFSHTMKPSFFNSVRPNRYFSHLKLHKLSAIKRRKQVKHSTALNKFESIFIMFLFLQKLAIFY